MSEYADPAIFRCICKESELLYFDIKQADPELHKKYTGVDNGIDTGESRLCRQDKKIYHIKFPVSSHSQLEKLTETACFELKMKSFCET